MSTSSRGGCAGARSTRRSAWRRRRSGCAASRCRSSSTLRSGSSNQEAVRALVATMLPAAHGLGGPPTSDAGRLDLRAFEATLRALDELDGVAGARRQRSTPRTSCTRSSVRWSAVGRPGSRAAWRCSTCCALARGTTRSSSCSAWTRARFLGAPARRASSTTTLGVRSRSGRAAPASPRPDPVAADRYLFYTACTRATRRLYLVREAATDDGSPREPSPFWEDVRALFSTEDVARWTRRRQLSEATWPMDRAPTERERLRATAALAGGGS